MRLHRFYIEPEIELKHDFWLHQPDLLHQWNKVLRFATGQQVVLFDGVQHERLYSVAELKPDEAHLVLITEFERKTPTKDIYLLWSLLKKDKNDWVLQKCTELGVSHFIPLIADRSEKTGFNLERAQKIVVEAAEQCGRSDIPNVREPITISSALDELKDKVNLFICEQSTEPDLQGSILQKYNSLGLLIGPEGGWSDSEKELFEAKKLQHFNLHVFTLRAETAAVAAVAKLLQ